MDRCVCACVCVYKGRTEKVSEEDETEGQFMCEWFDMKLLFFFFFWFGETLSVLLFFIKSVVEIK